MLKYVPEYVRRKAISESLEIPHLEIVQNGIVAIIDISGNNYTTVTPSNIHSHTAHTSYLLYTENT